MEWFCENCGVTLSNQSSLASLWFVHAGYDHNYECQRREQPGERMDRASCRRAPLVSKVRRHGVLALICRQLALRGDLKHWVSLGS